MFRKVLLMSAAAVILMAVVGGAAGYTKAAMLTKRVAVGATTHLPEPLALFLLGAGLASVASIMRKHYRSAQN